MPAFPIVKDSLSNSFTVNVFLIPFDIESNLFCVALKDWAHVKRFMPVFLILVNEIVHLPELTLKPGSLGRTCRGDSVLMRWRERKLSKRYLEPVAKLTVHLNENWM